MTDRKYCLYKHTSPSGKVYIGITCQLPQKRWLNGKGYAHNDYFTKAILKYGWNNFKHEILAENLTLEEAYSQEINAIKFYDSTNSENGYNAHKGGMGSHPDIPCDVSTRLKRKSSMRGKNCGKYNGGNSVRAKKIKQFDLNGNFITEYQATTEAAQAVNCNYTSIVRACRGQYVKSANSLWCYSGEEHTIPLKVETAKHEKRLTDAHKKHISQGMLQYRNTRFKKQSQRTGRCSKGD